VERIRTVAYDSIQLGENPSSFTASSTIRWSARELIMSDEDAEMLPSMATDVWSFGMLCLELLSGDKPFSNVSRLSYRRND
jgi:son of sevenless